MTRSLESLVVLVASTAFSALLLGVFAWSWGFERLDVRILLLTGLFVSLDFGDLLFRIYLRHTHTRGQPGTRPSPTSVRLDVGEFTPVQVRHHLKPYAVVASLYNAETELDDFLEAIEPFRDRVWVIDDASTDETVIRLQEAGIRCLPSPVNQKKPKALRDLVATLDPTITTVVVLDPDSRILHGGAGNDTDLERVVFEFQRSGAAGLCPCLTVRGHGLLGRLQQLEYWLSFNFGRYSLNDHSVTSGIAIYRRDALERILATASSVYAEDLNNTLSLLARGERVYYDGRLVVETSGKDTWPGWFSQRVGWYFGLLKVYVESWPELRRWARCEFFVWYQFVFYTGVVSIFLHPLRVMGLGLLVLSALAGVAELVGVHVAHRGPVLDPVYFVLTYVQGTLLVLLALITARSSARRRLWIRMLPAVPFYLLYALAQTIPITVGYLNWFTLRLFGRRVYRDHFQDDASLRGELYGAAR